MPPDDRDFDQMMNQVDIDMQSIVGLPFDMQSPQKLEGIPFNGFALDFSSQLEANQVNQGGKRTATAK